MVGWIATLFRITCIVEFFCLFLPTRKTASYDETRDNRRMDEGCLVTFDFSKNKQDKEPELVEVNGKRVFEVVV